VATPFPSQTGLPFGFFWGFVKDTASLPPLSAVALVSRDVLTRAWVEMDYRTNACRVSKGGNSVANYVDTLGECISVSL
jgi:hypothetical protein